MVHTHHTFRSRAYTQRPRRVLVRCCLLLQPSDWLQRWWRYARCRDASMCGPSVPSLSPYQPHAPPCSQEGDGDDSGTEDEDTFEVERVLNHRGNVRRSFLCTWVGYAKEPPTWEPEKSLLNNVEYT